METHFGNVEHAHSTLARERVLADLKRFASPWLAVRAATVGLLAASAVAG